MTSYNRAYPLLLALPFGLLMEAPAPAGISLANPDASQVYFLQQAYAGTKPDLNALAQTFMAVETADEFHKAAVTAQIVGQLQQQQASLRGVTTITIDLNEQLPAFDSDYDEYDFDISDGVSLSYQAFNNAVEIDLTNGTDAQSWALKPDIAERVLDEVGLSRRVILALTLQLESSPPGIEQEPFVLNTKILSYDVLTLQGVRLGHVDVKMGRP